MVKETMVLPNDAVIMQEDEMRYLDGGLALKVKRAYLNKATCIKMGHKYAGTDNLSGIRIAKEIYAHAILYYASSVGRVISAIGLKPIHFAACNYIRSHSNPIDIGGDNAGRVAVFNAIWHLM